MTRTAPETNPARVAALREWLRELVRIGHPERGLELARIAQTHQLAELVAVLESRDPVLPRAALRALAIEMALRSKGIPEGHPLLRPLLRGNPSEPPAWLVLPLEQLVPRSTLGFGRVPGAMSSSTAQRDVWAVEAGDPLTTRASSEVTTDADREAIAAAVLAWTHGSNGRYEVRVFALDGARGAHVDGPLLRTLGLAAVPEPSRDMVVEPVRADEVMAQLFAAGHGGAYNPRKSDATARDLAWRSLRGLIGVSPHAYPRDVAREAERAGFVRFARTSFFEDVAWDVGLAVVSGSRDRLAILAATDSD